MEASAQNWLPVGQIFDYGVTSLYSDSATNSLIAGGYFKYADGKVVNGVAAWNGITWDSLGSGISNCTNFCQGPWRIARYDSALYVTGLFTEIGHIGTRFARWNGIAWDTSGNFLVAWDSAGTQPTNPLTLSVINNQLWVVGGFYNAGGVLVNNSIALWDGSTYAPFATSSLSPFSGNGPAGIGYPTYFNGMWYFIGVVLDSNGQNNNVIRWTGTQWEIFGGGIKGGLSEVSSITVFNNELIIAGTFTEADGNPGNAIVGWDGNNWHDLGGGITDSNGYYGQIFDMTVFNNELWVVGNFQFAGGVYAKNIAKWNGVNWCSLGSYFDNNILSIESYNNEIYIGGGFWTIDGDSIQRIAKWGGGSFVDTCGIVSVFENPNGNEGVSVVPNPAQSWIQFCIPGIAETRTLVIFDLVGREVWRRESTETIIIAPVGVFETGMYYYSIDSGTGYNFNGKFMVEH